MEFLLVTLCFVFGFGIGIIVIKSTSSKKEKRLTFKPRVIHSLWGGLRSWIFP